MATTAGMTRLRQAMENARRMDAGYSAGNDRIETAMRNAAELDRREEEARQRMGTVQSMKNRRLEIDERSLGKPRENVYSQRLRNPFGTMQQTMADVRRRQAEQTEKSLMEQATGDFDRYKRDFDSYNRDYDRDMGRFNENVAQVTMLRNMGINDQAAEQALKDSRNTITETQNRWGTLMRQTLDDLGQETEGKLREMVEEGEGTSRYRELYREMFEKLGADLTRDLTEYVRQQQNAETMEQKKQEAAAYGREHGVKASVASVPKKVLGGVVGTLDTFRQGADRLFSGSNAPVDWNAPAQTMGREASAIRGSVSQKLDEQTGNGVASFLYNTGMSMLDSAAVLPMGGWGSVVLGTAAANDAMQEAKANGATDDQAIALGTISGVAEVLTEKVSIDSLFSLEEAKTARQVVGNIVKQAIPEASEEAISSVVNLFADKIILGEKSRYEQLVQEQMEQNGLNRDQAAARAFLTLAGDVGLDALGGAISGGLFATGKATGQAVGRGVSGRFSGRGTDVDGRNVIENGQNVIDSAESGSQAMTREQTDSAMLAALEQLKQENAKAGTEPIAPEAYRQTARRILDENIFESPVYGAALEESGLTRGEVRQALRNVARGNLVTAWNEDTQTVLRAIRTAEAGNTVAPDAKADNPSQAMSWEQLDTVMLNTLEQMKGQNAQEDAPMTREQTDAAMLAALEQLQGRKTQKDAPVAREPMNTETENGNLPETAVGAAESGFSGEIGTWKRDAKDFIKETELPKKDKEGKTISDSAGSMFASNVPKETKEMVERFAYEGELSYGKDTNKAQVERVHKEIERDGFDAVYERAVQDMLDGKANADLTARSWVLFVQAANRGDDVKAATLAKIMQSNRTDTAKALQANAIYSKLSPEGRLMAIMKTVNRINDEISEKKPKKTRKKSQYQDVESGNKGLERKKSEVKEAIDEVLDTILRLLQNNHDDFEATTKKEEKMDFDMWKKKLGETLAKAIEPKPKRPKNNMTVSKMIEQDLLRFAKDYLPQKTKPEKRTAVDTLTQYFEHPDWYVTAWNHAKEIVRERHKGDMDYPEFAGATMTFNGDGSDPVMTKAIVESAISQELEEKSISLRSYLGDRNELSTMLSDDLIRKTGAEGKNAQLIRDACARYVNNLGMENTKRNRSRIQKDIYANLKEAEIKIAQIIREHPGDREQIVSRTAQMLTNKYGVEISQAKKAAEKISDQFNQLIAKRAQDAVERIAKESEQGEKQKKNLSAVFRDLANMGVFLDENASEKVTRKLFGEEVQIDPKLMREYLDARGEEAIAAAEKKIYQDIGRQIPATFEDKWNAWRYLSMLGNFRTHGRNIAGNAMFAPVRSAKNLVETGMEAIAQKAGWIDQSQRTKSVGVGKDRIEAARADYENVKDLVLSGDKWNSASSTIEESRRIFKNPALEAVRKKNSELLDLEDSWFAKGAYASSLAGYLKAQGFTAADFTGDGMTSEQKSNARAYAIREARKATYRDLNAFSELVNKIGFKNPKNKLEKGINTLVEGVLPFKKTPANILARGVEYSPAGLVKALSVDIHQVANGKISASEYMDRLASGLTGTGLFALGMLLSKMGILTGGAPEDEEQAELEGWQPYAIEVGGKSFTLDWLAPEALPVFMGVELMETLTEDETEAPAMDKVINSLKGLSDPMLEMSMLSSLQDALEATEYADNKLTSFLANSALGYFKQAFPTIFGQLERTFGNRYRETTFTQEGDKWLNKDAQYTIGSIANKVPLWDYRQIPYIDAWGRMEDQGGTATRAVNNLINPSFVSELTETDVDKEIKRLEKATGKNYTPSRAEKVLTIDGRKVILTADEYVTYATAKGQNDFTLRTNLIGSDGYAALDDATKGKAMECARDYANTLAQEETGLNPLAPEWMTELEGADAETVTKTLLAKAIESQVGPGEKRYEDLAERIGSGVPPETVLAALTKEQQENYSTYIQPAGVPADVYLDVLGFHAGTESDKDKNGDTIAGSKKQKVVDYINGLNLGKKQKRALFLCFYSEKDTTFK